MRSPVNITICAALAASVAFGAGSSVAQPLSGAPAAPEFKFSTPTPPGVASPDTLDTRFGTLHFFGGFPDPASVDKLYDNLDFQHAVQAYLLALPVVSEVGQPRRHPCEWGRPTRPCRSGSNW